MFDAEAPADPAEFRRAVYAGRLFRLAASPASSALVRCALGILEGELGADPRHAQFRLTAEELQARVQRVRRALAEPAVLAGARTTVAAAGLDPGEFAFDAVRLRAVTHDGHALPAAAPAYTAHRDTWYANPRAQINWWIPLHDVAEEETFWFYPEAFARPVANTSHEFDWAEWKRRAGFQNPARDPRAVYPTVLEEPAGARGFACPASAVLVFSAAHLHRTRPNGTGRTRFSLDFRTVHRGDHALGLGAPDVDNRSTGSTLEEYA